MNNPKLFHLSSVQKIGYWFILWSLLGLLQTFRLYYAYNVYNPNILTWQKSAIWAFNEWYLWGLLSLLIVKIVHIIQHKSLTVKISTFIAGMIIMPALHLYLYSFVWLWTKNWYYAEVMTSYDNTYDIFIGSYLGKINDNSVAFFLIVAGIYAFNYYRQLFLEKTRIAELNRTLAETKLEQLKTQLQPHFLFNTLNTITALIHTDPEKADLVTTKLSDFLRTSLARDHQQLTTLDDEIDLLKKYLEIQQVRFEDRLIISFEIPQETKSALVPYLILQPLAENAIKHGISKQSGDGKIEIIGKIDGDNLVLTVRNSNAHLDDSFSIEQHAQIGLKNTVERLQYIYGETASFTIRNMNDAVEAVVTIPYQIR